MMRVRVYRLGVVEYQAAWKLQERLAAAIAADRHPPALLLLEHPHTYTFGRQGHEENLIWDAAERARRGVQVHWVDRGGDVTYHGPGQLVGYPLLPLGQVDARSRLPQADYVGYLRRLEETLIQTLAAFDVAGFRVKGKTGVWVRLADGRAAKVAAIGVKVDARGISRHGFALNVQPNMAYWQGIIGCGLKNDSVASLAQCLKTPPPMQQVMAALETAFARVFAVSLEYDQRGFDFLQASL